MPASNDPSSRYILPPEAPYLANLAALWASDPELARRVERDDSHGQFEVSPSRSGPPALAVKCGERTISLHSRYEPVAEARKLLDGLKIDQCVAFYVLGMGLGYHLEAIFERASEEAQIIVFEPDLDLLRVALSHRDLSAIIASGRVRIFTTADKSEIFQRLTPLSAMCSMGFEGVTHAPSLALHPEFFEAVQAIIADFASFARTSLNTLLINGRRTAENVTANLGAYASTPSVEALRGAFAGQPAIIVSAGPSLRKNKHHLLDAQGKAVIIAVQTILQPLIDMGIEPHFVTSLDYHDISTRYYEKLPADLRTHLVAEPKASPMIFDVFPGPVTILGNEYADKLLREHASQLAKGRLSSGATVAHLAYYLAEHLGCDPIIFVGQDLGFSDGLAYAPGTNIDDVWRPELGRFCTVEMRQWEFIARDRPILRRIPDYQDLPMYTEERLFTYLQQFERDFLRTRTRIIDASEGGAKKRGAVTMKLVEAIREYCQTPLTQERRADGKPGQQWIRAGQCAASLQARCEEARQIELISRDTLPLLEEIRHHLQDQLRVNQLIARIDALRARMDQLGPTYDLVTQLTQQTELQRFQRDRKIAAGKLTGIELQRRQIERDIENVRAVEQAAIAFAAMMTEGIQRLLAFTDPAAREAA